MIGTTDLRHMVEVVDHVYRFSSVHARPEDLPRFYGINKQITEANLVELIRLYHRLVQQTAGT